MGAWLALPSALAFDSKRDLMLQLHVEAPLAAP
jgi:hypothetical protein